MSNRTRVMADEIRLPGGQEPALGGQQPPEISGMEPELGGIHRVKVDPRIVVMLLGSEDERAAAITHVLDKKLGRLYALELVKIISAREVRRMRRKRWGYAYTTDQRIAATIALEAFGQEVAVEGLVEALGDGAWWVGQFAMDALVAVGSPAIEEVVKVLSHRNPIVRRRAADVLGDIGDRHVTLTLAKAYDDDTAWVRIRVVQALGRLDDPRAVPTLQQALRDEDGPVRRAAVEALSGMGIQAQQDGAGRNR
jgi:HEAT repeat protein